MPNATNQISTGIRLVMSLIFGLVAALIVIQVAPGLSGQMIVAVEGAYIENATGCFIDATVDTEVEDFYCSGLGLMPLVIVALVFVVVAVAVFGAFPVVQKTLGM